LRGDLTNVVGYWYTGVTPNERDKMFNFENAINWDKVDEILANPETPENKAVLDIINKIK
jgi:hypothetical protein